MNAYAEERAAPAALMDTGALAFALSAARTHFVSRSYFVCVPTLVVTSWHFPYAPLLLPHIHHRTGTGNGPRVAWGLATVGL